MPLNRILLEGGCVLIEFPQRPEPPEPLSSSQLFVARQLGVSEPVTLAKLEAALAEDDRAQVQQLLDQGYIEVSKGRFVRRREKA